MDTLCKTLVLSGSKRTRNNASPYYDYTDDPRPLKKQRLRRELFGDEVSQCYYDRQPLGRGCFAEVYAAKSLKDDAPVALKVCREPIDHEADILKKLQGCFNVVKVHEIHASCNTIALEQLSCTLESHVGNSRMDSAQCKSIMKQVLSALDYCHTRSIVHRDIKPNNVLIDMTNFTVKLSDFGAAIQMQSDKNDVAKQGRVPWERFDYGAFVCRAPEVLMHDKDCGAPADMWAVGCLFAYLLKGVWLFHRLNVLLESQQLDVIRSVLKRDLLDECPHVAMDLLRALLTWHPKERITAAQALEHPYFQK